MYKRIDIQTFRFLMGNKVQYLLMCLSRYSADIDHHSLPRRDVGSRNLYVLPTSRSQRPAERQVSGEVFTFATLLAR